MTVHALHGPQSDQFPSTIKDKIEIRGLKKSSLQTLANLDFG